MLLLQGQAFLPSAEILITCICLAFSHVGKGNGEDNNHPLKKKYVHEWILWGHMKCRLYISSDMSQNNKHGIFERKQKGQATV